MTGPARAGRGDGRQGAGGGAGQGGRGQGTSRGGNGQGGGGQRGGGQRQGGGQREGGGQRGGGQRQGGGQGQGGGQREGGGPRRARATEGQGRATEGRPRQRGPVPSGGPASPGRRDTDRGLGGDQVEGRRAVRELLYAHRRPVRDVWVSETRDESPLVAEILELAAAADVTVRRVSRFHLDAEAHTDAAQGVLAHARALPESELAELCEAAPGGAAPFLMVLDGITDPQNLGALLRTAEGAGVTGVVLPRHRAAHVTATVAKAAAGAIEYLPMAVVPGIPAALRTLASHGVWTVGLDAGAGSPVWGLSLATESVALVLGAEGHGLSRLTRDRCDVVVSVPLRGRLDALNVGAAGAVAAFEVARRRMTPE